MVHAGNCTRVQEYQTCAAALQQIVGHAASGRVPHENPSEVVLLAARWTSSPSKFATKIGVVLDHEVGLWRVANIEAGVMAAVSRVIPELAVCGTEGSDTLARVVRRHVVVRAGSARAGEDDSNSGEILYREPRLPHVVQYPKNITL